MLIKPEALVLDIQRMSTDDGPGLRTTLFLKGCSLHCQWCHNPDSIVLKPEVQWNKVKCIGCGSCSSICASGALQHKEKGIFVNYQLCNLCYSCINECPSGAMSVRGRRYDPDDLLRELLKDKAYFNRDGGVTISGGEPLLQVDTVVYLLRELKNNQVHTALDTAGLVSFESLARGLEFSDLLLYDIKIIDPALHKHFTGSGNEKILSNLVKVARYLNGKAKKIWIRTPLIPGATDHPDNIRGIARFLKEKLDGCVERWELCAFNNLCEHKYEMLNREWLFSSTPLMNRADLDRLAAIASDCLGPGDTTVIWTGRACADNGQNNNRGEKQ
jgi:pyruvate formate lyase activating enzyme